MKACSQLDQALYDHDLNALRANLPALFASIPHDWYRKNKLAEYEGHYASASDVGVHRRLTYEDSIIAVFYSQLAALGLHVQPEDITNAPVVGDARSLTNGDSTR